MMTWDMLVRDFLVLSKKARDMRFKTDDLDKVHEWMKLRTEVIDGKYVQRTYDKMIRDNECKYLFDTNSLISMKIRAALSNGKNSSMIESLDGVKKKTKGITSFFKDSKATKFIILGVGTLSVLWVVAKYTKLKEAARKAEEKDEKRKEHIKTRYIERIPMIKERVIESSNRIVTETPSSDIETFETPDERIVEERIIPASESKTTEKIEEEEEVENETEVKK